MELRISSLFLIVLLCSFSCSDSHIPIEQATTDDAHNAYFQMDHARAYAIYRKVFRDPEETAKDRADAGRNAAKMEWLFYQNGDLANATLDSAFLLNQDKSRLYNLKARISAANQKYDEAMTLSKMAMESADKDVDYYSASMGRAEYALNKYKEAVFEGSETYLDRNPGFIEAYQFLKEFAQPRPGDADLAKIKMGYAILGKNGEDLFDGWMSYFRLIEVDQIHPSLLKSPGKFKAATEELSNPEITPGQVDVLIESLAESGFYEYAVLTKKIFYGDSPSSNSIQEIEDYYDFTVDIKNLTENYYKEVLEEGEGQNKKEYLEKLENRAQELFRKLNWEGDAPEFSNEYFVEEIRRRFKTVAKLMNANGYFGLHMGQVVLDDKRVISQYGESAEFRFVQIDHMLSNGYSAWFWDGRAESGGWADDGESFLQVRSAYTSGPIRAWMAMSDSAMIQETVSDIEKYRATDDSIALLNPYAFLPGLSLRLGYEEKASIMDSLIDRGLEGHELRLAFINKIEQISLEASIYAHEGRHAIDKKNEYSDESKELEYTAKLSEVYFSEKPKYSIRAIISRNIGDDTSHGQANLRVIKGLVKWMETHSDQIIGYDNQRPALPQLDQLTDEQLRMAVRSLDPMANS